MRVPTTRLFKFFFMAQKHFGLKANTFTFRKRLRNVEIRETGEKGVLGVRARGMNKLQRRTSFSREGESENCAPRNVGL